MVLVKDPGGKLPDHGRYSSVYPAHREISLAVAAEIRGGQRHSRASAVSLWHL